MDFRTVRKIVHAAGLSGFLAIVAMTLLSLAQARVLWPVELAPRAGAVLENMGIPWSLAARVGEGIATPLDVIVVNAVLTLVATISAGAALIAILAAGPRDESKLRRPVLGWAMAGAMAATLTFPVFTQDMWLSVAWGRMALAGTNPFETPLQTAAMDGLPLDHFPLTMSYGPLWALVSTGIALVSGDSLVTAFIVSKLVLLAAWVTALLMVDRLAGVLPGGRRTLALVIFGWTPISSMQSIAEGHNDIVMAALLLLWLTALLLNRNGSLLALAGSSLVKYVSAPLVLADAVYLLSVGRMSMREYAFRGVAALLAAGLVAAVFIHSPKVLDGLHIINSWRFLQLRDAVDAIGDMAGMGLDRYAVVLLAVFPIIALWQLYMLWRRPQPDEAVKASLAILAAICFGAVNHLWPWYLIWMLPLAALVPGWWLTRYIIALSMLVPFTVAVWWIEALEPHRGTAAILLHSGVIAITLATSPALHHRLFPAIADSRN